MLPNTHFLISRNKREGWYAGKTRVKYYRIGGVICPLFKKRRTSEYLRLKYYKE